MLRYGFFDSEITGYDEEEMPIFDRAESSDFLALFISRLVSDGVLADPADCFRVIANEGMRLKVRPGFGIIKGRFAMDEQESEITIPTAPTAYKRIDRVILRANYLNRLCEIIVREGTPGANPRPPELLRPAAGDYYELCLATIVVNANQKAITQSNITDTRYDSRVCGVVTQIIDHLDTSVFFAQLNQFYAEFVKQCGESYESSKTSMNNYLQALKESGDSRLAEFANDFDTWFQSIKGMLELVENGDLLLEVRDLLNDMYQIATDEDIDRILNGTYVDDDNEGSIFEAGSNQDIDDIIAGTYIDQEEGEGGQIGIEQQINEIVNKSFENV